MADEHLETNEAGVPPAPGVETHWSGPKSDRTPGLNTRDTGCLGDNEKEDCVCPFCTDRYQVSSFYLEGLVRDDIDLGQVQKIVVDVVEQTAVSVSVGKGTDLALCGYYWDSKPGCRQLVLMASMEAHCVAEKLSSGLVSDLASLQCEAAPEIVVDTTGYGTSGESTSGSTFIFWYGLCLQRAWPSLLPEQAVRFGDPRDHVQRLGIDDGGCIKFYASDDASDSESTPDGTCASLEEDFGELGLQIKEEGRFED